MYRWLLLIALLLLAGCGGTVTPRQNQVDCNPPIVDPITGNSIAWEKWDGSQFQVENKTGSTFKFRSTQEGEKHLLWPSIIRQDNGETQNSGSREFKDRTLTPVFLGTGVTKEVAIASGVVYFYRCGDQLWKSTQYTQRAATPTPSNG